MWNTAQRGYSFWRQKAVTYLLVFLTSMLFLYANTSAAGDTQAEQITNDIAAVDVSRIGLQATLAFLNDHSDAFKISKGQIATSEQREIVLGVWQSFLDHILALDAIGARANGLYSDGVRSKKSEELQLAFLAFTTQYHYALAFLEQTEKTPALHVILNEPAAELGIPAGAYSAIKFRFLNVQRAAEFVWLRAKYQAIKQPLPIKHYIDSDSDYILKLKEHDGVLLTAKNGGRIVSDSLFTAWFPVQKGVSEWMGDTKVARKKSSLITKTQLHELQPGMEPGDILLVRHEWYLSNIGLPGYWPHAALYIGTSEERRAYFDDPAIAEWVKAQGEPSGDFEKLLISRSATAYENSRQQQHDEEIRIIEAISEGVSFTTLEHAADSDSLAVLRPNSNKQMKARAIMRAFHLSGRPYDFDFNFLTDAALVCTELVYKAYEGEGGLSFPLQTVLGRPVLPANRIASLFDEQYESPARQLEFVAFYDGHEWSKQAAVADVTEFRRSWRRPRWFIFTQDMGSNQATHQFSDL